MSDNNSSIVSFIDAKKKRGLIEEVEQDQSEYKYEYNLVIKITHDDKIHAIFQTFDQEVPEEDQLIHLSKLVDVMKAGQTEVEEDTTAIYD